MKMTTAQVVETSVAVNNNRFYSGLRSRGWSNSTDFWNRSWVQTFHTTFFVRLKDQGVSYNKYFCEDGKVSGLGNLPSETNLTVNKDQANHCGLSISFRRGVEKYQPVPGFEIVVKSRSVKRNAKNATAPFSKSRASYFRFARFNTSALYYLRAWHRLEKYTSEETSQDSTPLACVTILSLRWHKYIKLQTKKCFN